MSAWTKERPTKPGLYWVRGGDGQFPAGPIIEVGADGWFYGIGSDRTEFLFAAWLDGYEYAPAEPPP